MRWWGYEGPLQAECKQHFLQFSGLITGNVLRVALWEIVWFAAVWVIWSARNVAIFRGKIAKVADMVEQVKLKSWLWITSKNPKFNYPLPCWLSNPTSCLGLRVLGNQGD